MKFTPLSQGLALFLLVSCQDSLNHYQLIGTKRFTNTEIVGGIFQAALRPINSHLSGQIPYGMIKIHIFDQNLQIASWIDDSANVKHPQFIFEGTSCPTMEDDTNQDGIVDLQEASTKVKKMLIPLDDNLNHEGIDHWDQSVSDYSYFQEASLSNKTDMDFEGKVVMVLGATPHQGIDSKNVPIVCGILHQLKENEEN